MLCTYRCELKIKNKELKIKEYSDIYRKVKIDLQKRFCNLQNRFKLYLRYDSTKAHKNNE